MLVHLKYLIKLTSRRVTMSKLWNTLKSVVGGHAVEDVAAAAKTAASVSSAPVGAPAVTSDGMLQGFAAIKPHQPLIKFR